MFMHTEIWINSETFERFGNSDFFSVFFLALIIVLMCIDSIPIITFPDIFGTLGHLHVVGVLYNDEKLLL